MLWATGSLFELEVETALLSVLGPHLPWLSPGARRAPVLRATTPALTALPHLLYTRHSMWLISLSER